VAFLHKLKTGHLTGNLLFQPNIPSIQEHVGLAWWRRNSYGTSTHPTILSNTRHYWNVIGWLYLKNNSNKCSLFCTTFVLKAEQIFLR